MKAQDLTELLESGEKTPFQKQFIVTNITYQFTVKVHKVSAHHGSNDDITTYG